MFILLLYIVRSFYICREAFGEKINLRIWKKQEISFCIRQLKLPVSCGKVANIRILSVGYSHQIRMDSFYI